MPGLQIECEGADVHSNRVRQKRQSAHGTAQRIAAQTVVFLNFHAGGIVQQHPDNRFFGRFWYSNRKYRFEDQKTAGL
ncbi:MAG: hypothetical protein R3C26_10655 [Calditrichia bacterium]